MLDCFEQFRVALGAERQITAAAPARLLVCGHGSAVACVAGEDAPRGTPSWIA